MESGKVVIEADAARQFVVALMTREGVPADGAAVIADALVLADLRGVDTHGVARLPGYVDRLRKGLVNPRPELDLRRVAAVAAHLDGDDGFGFVVARRAMEEAIAMARENGLGLVSVKRSSHYGMAANYLLQAIRAGFAALVFTNASRAMPPWGGREALLGTSPFAAGIPGGAAGDFVLDMAPSVAARGKIRKALRNGETIPEGYALDAHGRPTTDPAEALKGVVLPIGGPKGSGLSMLMDILGGVMSGSAFAGDVGNQYEDYDRPQNVGHFFLVMKPDLFIGADAFRDRMDVLLGRVRSTPKAAGFDEVLIPGEPEARHMAERSKNGIPYSLGDLQPLLDLAADIGIAPPPMKEAAAGA